MVGLFFNPQGRIASGPFWLGAIVLLVISCALGAIPIFMPQQSQQLGLVLALISILLIYPSVCVYGKRLHDAGKSAWWYLAIIAVSIIVVGGIGIALTAPYFPAITEASQSNDQARVIEVQRQIQQATFLPNLVASVVVTLIITFVVGNLRSDPGENKYGPPPAAKAASPA